MTKGTPMDTVSPQRPVRHEEIRTLVEQLLIGDVGSGQSAATPLGIFLAEVEKEANQLDFNAQHLIAEGNLDDALRMLDAARGMMAGSAGRLRAALGNLPATADDLYNGER